MYIGKSNSSLVILMISFFSIASEKGDGTVTYVSEWCDGKSQGVNGKESSAIDSAKEYALSNAANGAYDKCLKEYGWCSQKSNSEVNFSSPLCSKSHMGYYCEVKVQMHITLYAKDVGKHQNKGMARCSTYPKLHLQ